MVSALLSRSVSVSSTYFVKRGRTKVALPEYADNIIFPAELAQRVGLMFDGLA